MLLERVYLGEDVDRTTGCVEIRLCRSGFLRAPLNKVFLLWSINQHLSTKNLTYKCPDLLGRYLLEVCDLCRTHRI